MSVILLDADALAGQSTQVSVRDCQKDTEQRLPVLTDACEQLYHCEHCHDDDAESLNDHKCYACVPHKLQILLGTKDLQAINTRPCIT